MANSIGQYCSTCIFYIALGKLEIMPACNMKQIIIIIICANFDEHADACMVKVFKQMPSSSKLSGLDIISC